jgi:O-antigen/teichoic acid export membrane protein
MKDFLVNRESLLFFSTTVSSTLVTILSTVILIRIFSVEDFGRLQSLTALYGILGLFLMHGLNIFIQKSMFEQRYEFVSYVYRFMIIYIIPVSFFILIILGSIYPVYEKQILYSAVLMMFFSSFDRIDPILSGLKKFRISRILLLARQLIYLAFIISMYYVDFTIYEFLAFHVFLSIFFSSLNFIIGIIHVPQIKYISVKGLNRTKFNKAFKNSLASSWGHGAVWIDKVLLSFISLESLAILHVAQLIPKVIKDNAKSLFFVPVNTWVTMGDEFAFRKVWKYRYIITSIGLFFTLALVLTGTYIIDLAFSSKYSDAYFYLIVFSSTISFQFLSYFIHSVATLGNDIEMFNKVLLLGPSIKIIGSLILVPLYSMDGAIISNIVAEISIYAYTFYFFFKKMKSLNKINEK